MSNKPTNRVHVANIQEMLARLILAAMGTGMFIALGMALREQGSVFDWALTVVTVTISTGISGVLASVRPISSANSATAGIVSALREAPFAKWLLSDRAAQWLLAVVIGLVVASTDSALQSALWSRGEVNVWQQLLSLSLVLLPMWFVAGLVFPRERSVWVRKLGAAIREAAKKPALQQEPGVAARAAMMAVARTTGTVIVRSASIVVLGWVFGSWYLTLALGLALLLVLTGGETLLGLWRLLQGRRADAAEAADAAPVDPTLFSTAEQPRNVTPLVLPEPPTASDETPSDRTATQ